MALEDELASLFEDGDSLFGDSDDSPSPGPSTPGFSSEQEADLLPTPVVVPGKQIGGLALPTLALPKLAPAAVAAQPLTGPPVVARDDAEMVLGEAAGMNDQGAAQMAADPAGMIDLTGPEPEPPAQRPNVAAPRARRKAGNAQNRPPPPAQVPDDVDHDTASGKWGRWCPKSMTLDSYVLRERPPYDRTNPRDVYDFLQAVIACLARNWPGKQWCDAQGNHRIVGPSSATMHWFRQAWQMLCASLRAQHWKFGGLIPEKQAALQSVLPLVEHDSLPANPLEAEIAVETAMSVLLEYFRMGAPMPQGPGSAAHPIMVG